MQNLFKDFFYFSRGEKRGILMLITTICIVFLAGYLISAWQRRDQTSPNDRAIQATAQQEYEEFIASLEEKEQSDEKQYTSYKQKKEESIPVILVSFNPNTADSITFRHLGLPAWMTKNILHYRYKQGKFRHPEDFRKIYGLTEEQYQTLRPYIQITEDFSSTNKDTVRLLTAPSIQRDTLVKYLPGTVISLNSADTTELKKIPGIGSSIARMIVNYRERLGGFFRIEQLQEIHLKAEKLRPWFSIDTHQTRRINVNKAGMERMMHHPYINYYQAKVIIEYRKKKGFLKSLKQLSLYEEFTPIDLERLEPYICYN